MNAVVLRIQSNTSVTSASEADLAAEVEAANQRAQEHSFGLVSISNDRDGDGRADIYTVRLNVDSAGVGESQAFTYCNQAIQAAGVSNYRHYICILPPDMNYSWYGQAYIGGTTMVIDGQYARGYPNGLLHEIGHNWGRHHSNSESAEYGDSSCVMGGNAGTANRHFNGPQKAGLGWLTARSVGAGSYALNAVESSAGERLLKIRDVVANQDIYLSFRARIGDFSSGPINPARTAIHTWAGGSQRTYRLATLGDGETFTRNGISITQDSNTGTSATVRIATNCSAAAPSLSGSPSSFTSSGVTEAVYTLSITNNDVNCSDPTVFNLTASSPEGIGVQLGSSSESVAPGETVTVDVVALPSSDATSDYRIALTASANNHPSSSVTVTYSLDSVAPGAVSLSGSAQKSRAVLSWGAGNDLGSGVADYRVFRDGANIGTTSSTSYSDNAGSGTFAYHVVVVDRAGNVGLPSNTVSVTIGGGKGGSGGKGGKR